VIGLARREISRAVFAPLAVATAIRVLFAFTDNIVGPDEANYLETGRNIWAGHGITFQGKPELHFPPLLPMLLGALAKITPEPHHATVIVTLLASVALVPIVGAIAWRIAGRRAGLLAMWIAALSPGLSVTMARGAGGSEALFAALILAAALVTIGSGRWTDPPSLPRALAVGALVGAAYLVRPEGVMIVAVFGFILALRAVGGRVQRSAFSWANLRRVAALGAACAAGLLVFVAPYVAFLHSHTGKWELTAKSVDVDIQAWRELAEQDRATRETFLYRLDDTGLSTKQKQYSLTALAREHPRQYLDIVAENVRQLYKSLLSFNTTLTPGWRLFALPLLPFALYGLWRNRTRSAVVAVTGILGLSLAVVLGFFVLNRYLPPAIAALSVLAGVGLSQLRDRPRKWWVAIGLAASVLSLMTYLEGPHGPQLVRERPEVQVAARWLRGHVPKRAAVMTRSASITYYLPDNRLILPPVGSIAQVYTYARYHHAKYLVLDPTTQLLRPDLAPLSDGRDHRADGFELVHRFRVEDRTTVILKLVPTA
jgi:hypothetical protein